MAYYPDPAKMVWTEKATVLLHSQTKYNIVDRMKVYLMSLALGLVHRSQNLSSLYN